MKKHLVCFAAVCGCIAVIVCLALENVRIKQRISTEEKPQLQALKDMYENPMVVPDVEQVRGMKLIYVDIVNAYTNGDYVSMCKHMAMMPRVHDKMHPQVSAEVMRTFVRELNGSFLRIEQLRDFSKVEDFEKYVEMGVKASMFYAESEMRQKNFEFPVGVEYLVLSSLQRYRDNWVAD